MVHNGHSGNLKIYQLLKNSFNILEGVFILNGRGSV